MCHCTPSNFREGNGNVEHIRRLMAGPYSSFAIDFSQHSKQNAAFC